MKTRSRQTLRFAHPKSHHTSPPRAAARKQTRSAAGLVGGAKNQPSGAFLSSVRAKPAKTSWPKGPVRASKPGKATDKMILPILAELLPRGDGTFVLKPRLMQTELDCWVSPRRAAELIGVQARSVYRLSRGPRPYLVAKHPVRRKTLVSMRSVRRLIEATNNRDFWDDRLQRAEVMEAVQVEMKTLRERASQGLKEEKVAE